MQINNCLGQDRLQITCCPSTYEPRYVHTVFPMGRRQCRAPFSQSSSSTPFCLSTEMRPPVPGKPGPPAVRLPTIFKPLCFQCCSFGLVQIRVHVLFWFICSRILIHVRTLPAATGSKISAHRTLHSTFAVLFYSFFLFAFWFLCWPMPQRFIFFIHLLAHSPPKILTAEYVRSTAACLLCASSRSAVPVRLSPHHRYRHGLHSTSMNSMVVV